MAGPLQDAWDWIRHQYSPEELKKNLSPSENPGEKGNLNPDTGSPEGAGKDILKGLRDAAKGAWTGGGDKDPDDDTLGQDEVGNQRYKFTALSDPTGEVQDYTETPQKGANYTDTAGIVGRGDLLQQAADPKKLSDKEYDALTKEASKGNKLAQSILVSGHYKAHDYPTMQQDIQKMEDPFVSALSGLPALAQNEQTQANKVTQPYDFTNAEAQVNSILGQMGSSQRMTTSPETNSYVSQLQGIVNQGANNLTSGVPSMGIPSIMSALKGLGPAAKESVKATPYESLLSALLSHQQYEYETGGETIPSANNPAWLQSLIAAITGTTATGGLVNPTIAAGETGTPPSSNAGPTGSNA